VTRRPRELAVGPEDQFALIIRAYVPEPAILDNANSPPNARLH
jgi:hypothetical protein